MHLRITTITSHTTDCQIAAQTTEYIYNQGILPLPGAHRIFCTTHQLTTSYTRLISWVKSGIRKGSLGDPPRPKTKPKKKSQTQDLPGATPPQVGTARRSLCRQPSCYHYTSPGLCERGKQSIELIYNPFFSVGGWRV